MIEAIQAVQAFEPSSGAGMAAAPASGHAALNSITTTFEAHLDRVNTSLATAEQHLQDLAAGKPVALHDMMIAMETARIGVQTVIQVRNRLTEAYQEVMRMQL